LNSILSKAKLGTQAGGRPPAAVEISPEGVLAAANPGPGQSPVYAFQALPVGAILPGIGEPNLREAEIVAAAIRSTLGLVSPRTRSVTLVLPDTVVRVFVLDFDSLPSKASEIYPVLRFRLRKMVPFEVEHAGLSYQVLVEKKDECKVLAAVMPGPVLAEYEAAVRAAGYEPGAVLPSGLAALEAGEASQSMEAVLIASLSELSLTTSITNGQDLLLYRTLDLPGDPELRAQEVQRGIAVAAAYYEDKLGSRARRLYLSHQSSAGNGSNGELEAFARWIDDPELTVLELAPRPEAGAVTSLGGASIAGVAGALALHGGQAPHSGQTRTR
jgi:type IV pilus assembly protein PilM